MPQKKDKNIFVVPSQSNPQKTYTITHNGGWECPCPDHQEVKLMCKHIQSLQIWEKLAQDEGDEFMDRNLQTIILIYCVHIPMSAYD